MKHSGGWLPLRPGSTVDLVAPGMRLTDEKLEAACTFLEKWKLVPRVPKHLFGRDPVCSNSDSERFRHLKSALLAEDSSVIWCLRGGYGSIRLLPHLAKMRRPPLPKLIVGLSDITSLQLFVGQRWGWATLHGPHLDRLGTLTSPPKVVRAVKQVLFGQVKAVEFAKLKPMNELAEKKRRIRAQVTGGNLVTVQSTIGTDYEIDARGRILFFEDLGERGYRVDRVLEHLRQAGVFGGVRAVVLGQFTGGEEPDGRKLWRPVLERFADQAPFPVLKGLPSGHDVMQMPLPMHTSATLELGRSGGCLVCGTGV